MEHQNKTIEKGQAIVIVAVMMIAFAAVLALAIDGGLTYFQRRVAQNAADAAALAGARVMCITGGGDPVAEARNYAARNGIPDPDSNVMVATSQVGMVRSVAVTVTIPYETFFAGLIGIADAEVGAEAEAACYPPCSGSGVLPIAWSCTPPDVGGGSISDTCDVYAHDADGCQYGDDSFYIVADSDSIEEDIVCQDPGDPVNPAYVDCDIDNDGINDVEVLSGANRSWLNLDGGSTGSSEMENWIRGEHVPEVRNHTWFAGSTGVRDSVYQAVEDYRLNQYVIIPVFDLIAPGLKNKELPSQFHTGVDLFVDSGAGDYFHVMTFATFYVTCVSTGSHDHCPAKDDLLATGAIKKDNTKTIEGCFKQGLFEGGGLPGECSIDAGTYVLKLIR
jgi:hypothetical protein